MAAVAVAGLVEPCATEGVGSVAAGCVDAGTGADGGGFGFAVEGGGGVCAEVCATEEPPVGATATMGPEPETASAGFAAEIVGLGAVVVDARFGDGDTVAEWPAAADAVAPACDGFA